MKTSQYLCINKKEIKQQSKKITIMKATKRFIASEIVVYRLSNSTKQVSFDTLEECIEHVKSQKAKHPRSKKFDGVVIDTKTNERINVYYLYC